MSEHDETLAEIVAGMRCGTIPKHRTDHELLALYADRIEAAHKREREELEEYAKSKILDGATIIDNRTVGNSSAMREALETARDLLLPQCNGGTAFARACGSTVNKIMDALAAPPRNCDRFGGDYKMLHTAWFDWTGSPSGQNPDGTVKMAFGEWLLAPAIKKGGAK